MFHPECFGPFLRIDDSLVPVLRWLLFHGSDKGEYVQKLARDERSQDEIFLLILMEARRSSAVWSSAAVKQHIISIMYAPGYL